MKIIKNLLSGNDLYVRVIIFLLVSPFLFISLFVLYQMPWEDMSSWIFCTNATCVEAYAESYLSPFVWYSSWLGVLYNIATISGVSIAVLTYYKTTQSQAISNHFSNVDLFKNYISEEVSKKDWLSIASFDLMAWYLKIYPNSKLGDMDCSIDYVNVINEMGECISKSNNGNYSGKKIGYQFSLHQKAVKKIYKSIGISVKETNRLSFYEIEGEILDLIDKVNKTFPNMQKFNKFPIRTYK